jgi:protocatechuate 3,4-dioxygenase beta subunit
MKTRSVSLFAGLLLLAALLPGSLLVPADAGAEDLVLDGGALTLTTDTRYGLVTLSGGAVLTIQGGLTLTVDGALTLTGGSTLLLQGKNVAAKVDGSWQGVGVTIAAGEVSVAAGSRISADGQGYLGGWCFPAEDRIGHGPGGGATSGGAGAGGGHGGRGGNGSDSSGGASYGSGLEPADLGSGGALNGDCSPGGTGGPGGGAITLTVAGTLDLEGTISADGADGVGSEQGGGAGGSIRVAAGILSGSGAFSADGGRGLTSGGGGGGGRIFVSAGDAGGFHGLPGSTVDGGAGFRAGEPGTVALVAGTAPDTHFQVVRTFVFPEDSVIRHGRLTLSGGGNLTVGGGSTLALDGALTVRDSSLLLLQGKNRSARVDDTWRGVGVSVQAADVAVEAGSRITADGQGYLGGWCFPSDQRAGHGPGGGGTSSWGGAGGGYGGEGGAGGGVAGGLTYGSNLLPTDLGSGGALNGDCSPGGSGGPGGGAILLEVSGTLDLGGTISADGGDGVGSEQGGGSGGSLLVNAGALTGSGIFLARGGRGPTSGGGGGGGRIIVSYQAAPGFGGFGSSSAAGGSGALAGAAGTLAFIDRSVPGGHFQVYESFLFDPESSLRYGRLTLADGALLTLGGGSSLTVDGTLSLSGASTLTLRGRNTAARVDGAWRGAGVSILAGNVLVATGSRITADGEGYLGGWCFPSTERAGHGPGGGGINSASGAGGGYGGQGGNGADSSGGATYGSNLEPSDLGSGGGLNADCSPGGTGGAGGGAILLTVAGTLSLEGEISADGTDGYLGEQGGGAGGTVRVSTDILAGAGSLSADGGRGVTSGGGGGGGRIIVSYRSAPSFTGFTRSTVDGGTGTNPGQAGTIAFIDRSVPGSHFQVYRSFLWGDDSAVTWGRLTLAAGATLTLGGGSHLAVDGPFTAATGAVIHQRGKNAAATVDGLWAGRGGTIQAGSLTMAAGSRLLADGQGYLGGWCHPAPDRVGHGPGGGGTNNASGGGGAHGGTGGNGSDSAGGVAYGSETLPLDLGSGGALNGDCSPNGAGGAGGGAVFINVSGPAVLDGEISADGTDGVLGEQGGGAGGSILLAATSLSGSGTLSATGGRGSGTGGGGGGGRIAIHSAAPSGLPPGNLSVAGGSGHRAGGTGTVVISASTSFALTEPSAAFVHGTVPVRWIWLPVPSADRHPTVDLTAVAAGKETLVAAGIAPLSPCAWDTTLLPDGPTELLVTFREGGAAVHRLSRTVTILNSPPWEGGTLPADATWTPSDVHVVGSDLVIPPGMTLSLDPGTILKFLRGVKIRIQSGGTLRATGTAARPVILTALTDDAAGGDTNLDGDGTVPVPGWWGGISREGTGQTLFDGEVEIRYALQSLAGGSLTTDTTWGGTFAYHLGGDLTIPSGVTLTVEPGAVVKLGPKKGITVQAGGTLVAHGTLARPITFTSLTDDSAGGDTNGDGSATAPAPGDWRWIKIDGGTASFDHSLIAYGGGTASGSWDQTGCLTTSGAASLTLANSTLRDSFFDGVLAWGGTVAITNSLLTGIDRAVSAHPGSPVTVLNCTLDDNRIGLLVHGGSLTANNTLVTNSRESGVQFDFGSAPVVRYSDVWAPPDPAYLNYRNLTDPTGTAGNVSTDPLYRDRPSGDFRLDFGSPAIDAADGTLAPALDSFGAPRYNDPRTEVKTGLPDGGGLYPDMGAREFVEGAESALDLVVPRVNGPAAVTQGQTATVTWTVRNVGSGTVRGEWHDALFLWTVLPSGEESHLPLALVLSGATLGPGQEASFSAPVAIPGGTQGPYRWLVRTNQRGEVFEGRNAFNNDGWSDGQTYLTLPELAVDGPPLAGTLTAENAPLIVTVRPEPGDTVVVSLDRADGAGFTRLYLGCGQAPTGEEHCGRSRNWMTPDASLAIENAREEVYHLMVLPASLPSGPASFTLSARRAGFTLGAPEVASGANLGPVTIPLSGTGFLPGARASLDCGAAVREASAVYREDATRLYPTFDLLGLAPGGCDLAVEQGDTRLTLPAAFAVVAGIPGEVHTDLVVPTVVRIGRDFTVQVDFRNTGQTDAPAALVLVEVGRGGGGAPPRPGDDPSAGRVARGQGLPPLRPAVSAAGVVSSAQFLTTAPRGPAGTLYPGERGRTPVVLTAQWGTNVITSRLVTVESTAALDWDAVRDSLRPAEAPPEWDEAWAALVARYGPAAGGYVRLLGDAAVLMDLRTGERTGDVPVLLAFMLRETMTSLHATLTGTIFLGDGNHPLGGVTVVAVGRITGTVAYAVSGADGLVRFTDLPPDQYDLWVLDWLLEGGPATVTVTDSGPVEGLVWTVRPGGAITGSVSVPAGTDLAEAGVMAWDLAGNAWSGTVAAAGAFLVRGLPDGTYDVIFDSPDLECAPLTGVVLQGEATVHGGTIRCSGAGSVTGTVSATGTGAPLEGISVVVAGLDPPRSAVSGADGSYRLDGIPAGTHTLRAHGAGHRADPREGVAVTPGRTTPGVDFAMVPGGGLSGLVTDAGDAAPVAGAGLFLLTGGELADYALAGTDGRYRLTNLAAGVYTLRIEADGFFPREVGLTLGPGEDLVLNAALSRAGSIQGRIGDAGGTGLAGIPLLIIGRGGPPFDLAVTDDQGRYRFAPLTPDEYVVMFLDGSNRRYFDLVGGDASQVQDFTLETGGLLGRVLDAGGAPLDGARVDLLEGSHAVLSTLTGLEGRFYFPYVTPLPAGAPWRLRVTAPGLTFAPLEATVTPGELTLLPDHTPGTSTLTVGFTGGGGLPPTPLEARLGYLGHGGEPAAWDYGTADAAGSVTFRNLVPGDYLLEQVGPDLGPGRTTVTLTEGENLRTVVLSAGGTVRGTALDADGFPIPGLTVTLDQAAAVPTALTAVTGSDGGFSLERVPPGSWDLTVADLRGNLSDVSYRNATLTGLAVAAGETTLVDLAPTPAQAVVTGRIRDSRYSAPLAGTVEALDHRGRVAARATADGQGTFFLKTLAPGAYTLRAFAPGWSLKEATLVLGEEDLLAEADLPLEWRGSETPLAPPPPSGALAGSPLPPSSPLAADGAWEWLQGGAQWLQNGINGVLGYPMEVINKMLDYGFNQQWMNGINDLVQRAHGRPERLPDLPLPAKDPECPEEMAWIREAIKYDRAANGKFDAWTMKWEGAWVENYANLGMFGINLLKFAGSLLALQFQGTINGTPAAISGELEQLEAGIGAANDLSEWNRLVEARNMWADLLKGFNAWKGVGDNVNLGQNVAGIPGILGNLMGLPDALSGGFPKMVDWGNNLAQFLNTTGDVLLKFKRFSDLLDSWPAGKAVKDRLGPITDGISTVLEAGNGVATLYRGLMELEQLKNEYKDLIGMRDHCIRMAWAALKECRKKKPPEPPPVPPPPKPPGDDSDTVPGAGSWDPNMKMTTGYGVKGYIPGDAVIVYTILFENKAEATAPAQRVEVTDALPSSLDLATLELLAIGFNGTVLSVPPGMTGWTATAAVPTDPYPVAVEAHLDPAAAVLTWVMQSVDPVTGLLPEDPLAGFLPPNDPACGHCGEGFLTFLVRPRAGLRPGTAVRNQASIVFDVNPPLLTNRVSNTVVRITPTAGTVGTRVTVEGAGFGRKRGSLSVGGLPLTVVSWSAGKAAGVVGRIPKGPGAFPLRVTPKGKKALELGVFAVRPPSVALLSADHGRKGARITVTGTWFGAPRGTVALKKGKKTAAAKVLSWKMDAVTGRSTALFLVPAVPAGTYDLILTGKGGSDKVRFTVDR